MLYGVPALRYLNEDTSIDGTVVGGDLAGTLPNPTLTVIGPPMGPTGNATTVASVTVDEKGRVTALTAVPITFPPADVTGVAVGGDLAGTLPNPTLAVIGAGGTIGNSTTVAQVTIDTKGRVSTLTAVPIAFPGPAPIAYDKLAINIVGTANVLTTIATYIFPTGWNSWEAIITWRESFGASGGTLFFNGGFAVDGGFISNAGGFANTQAYGLNANVTNFYAVQTVGQYWAMRYTHNAQTQTSMILRYMNNSGGTF